MERGRLRGAWARAAPAVGALLISLAVLVGAAGLGMRVPGDGTIASSPDAERLSTPGPRVTFDPLRDELLRRLFGDGLPVSTLSADLPSGSGAFGSADQVAPLETGPCDGFLCDAIRIPAVPYTDRRDTSGAGRKSGDPPTCAPAGGTVWYRYVAPVNEVLTADTSGSDYPLALAVFRGPKVADLTQVSCATGVAGDAELGWFSASQGETYWFQVTGLTGGGHLVFKLAGGGVGALERVSVTETGAYPDSKSFLGGVTPDGRYVAFVSAASNMGGCGVPSGTERSCWGVYLRDRLLGTTVDVVAPLVADDTRLEIMGAAVSADARYVAFSTADDLTSNTPEASTEWNVYVKDRLTGRLERDSVSSTGAAVHPPPPAVSQCGSTCSIQGAFGPSISADGRFVTFMSDDAGLVPGYEPPCTAPSAQTVSQASVAHCQTQVYVHDRTTGTTRLVSVAPTGEPMNGASSGGAISADGRFVTFSTAASNGSARTAHCAGSCPANVYVRDLTGQTTTLVSAPPGGVAADGDSGDQTISADGQHVVFASAASNLTLQRSTAPWDAYEWDAGTGQLTRVSVSSAGQEQHTSTNAVATFTASVAVSGDGRYTVFGTDADNLGAGHSGVAQIYVHDRQTGLTVLVSASPTGQPANKGNGGVAIGADASTVAFQTSASNLVHGDPCTPDESPNGVQRSVLYCDGIVASQMR